MENDNKELLELLKRFEDEYDIRLIFVCESASRAYGVEVEESDYDLKGLFLPNPRDSLRVIKKIEPAYKIPHIKYIKDDKEYDVDVEFIDFREFAVMKNTAVCYFDFSMFSPTIYINLFPEVIQTIQTNLKPMPNEFLYRFRNMHQACEKTFEKSKECMNKKLLGTLIHGVQYVHIYLYKTFPFFNIFQQIDFFKEKINKDEVQLSKSEISLLLEIFELIRYYFDEKKKGRKSNSPSISDYQYRFNDLLEKIHKEDNKKEEVRKYTLKLELFQELLDKMLTRQDLFNKSV
jgi:hypothetical protein